MDMTWWLVAGAAVVVLAGFAVWRRSAQRRRPGGPARPPRGADRPAPRRGGGKTPAAGEIWWANVPFEDGSAAKDRPCLVLSVRGRTVRVAKITSKFHEELPGVITLPPGAVGDAQGRTSYLETDELREVRSADFRRRAGVLDADLWRQVQRMVG
ncbi:type II toxin-antitoxin system PemK/MazF family toxin [Streptomyces sp. NPDC006733]|uniref:type II toxin-antitoxin system PemK/MazF family toxin n=1 Tax=Streptomyces sp. NPDC006733 TaxID=3155460 RepID=UPI0033CE4D2B